METPPPARPSLGGPAVVAGLGLIFVCGTAGSVGGLLVSLVEFVLLSSLFIRLYARWPVRRRFTAVAGAFLWIGVVSAALAGSFLLVMLACSPFLGRL